LHVAATRKILLRASYVPYYCCTRPARGEACGAPWKCNHPLGGWNISQQLRRQRYGTGRLSRYFHTSASDDYTYTFNCNFTSSPFSTLYCLAVVICSICPFPSTRVSEQVLGQSYSEAMMPIQVGSFSCLLYSWNVISYDRKWEHIPARLIIKHRIVNNFLQSVSAKKFCNSNREIINITIKNEKYFAFELRITCSLSPSLHKVF